MDTERPQEALQRLCVESYLVWIDDLLSQKGVLSRVAVKQSPVHLQIPDQSVTRAHRQTANVQIEEDLGLGACVCGRDIRVFSSNLQPAIRAPSHNNNTGERAISGWHGVCQPTFVCAVEGGEGDSKEGGGVFASINQMREGPLGVTVTAQTLDEPEPRGETLDHRPDAIRVRVAHIITCRGRHLATGLLGHVRVNGEHLTSADEPVVFGPVQLEAVETDHVLQVHQHHHQGVQLVSQPEVCEANTVKRSRHHSELWRKTSQEEPSSE